ncbi:MULTISPECIES: cytochrome bd oxidase small subunit, CydX/CbdX family [Pasteurellaceae]|nr:MULTISPECIES: cytochrome bd oxidase small subunit, CydX/CbdX family [Pasteurellaceae]SUB20974.1 Membrane bound YbgT-like protein [Pasteurella bettyae]
MFYVAWVVGVLLAVWVSVKITTRIEDSGKFDE